MRNLRKRILILDLLGSFFSTDWLHASWSAMTRFTHLRITKSILLLLFFMPINNIHASPNPSTATPNASTKSVPGDALDTITGILDNLTCETQGVGNLLRSEFSHTCIPAPFFTFALMNLVSPVLYMNTFLRLKINDNDLFGAKFPGGQCTRENRADSDDPKLTFGLCSNAKLVIARATAVAQSSIAIAKAVLTGDDPWDDIQKAWQNNKADYHNIYTGGPGTSGTMFDVGFPIIPWKIIQDNDRICVSTPGFTGYVPVGCKYIKEPFPESIYSGFMTVSSGNTPVATDPLALVDCAADGGCYRRAYNSSKTAIVISAPVIECIKEMTARLLISRDVCTFDNVDQIMSSAQKETSSLFQFQRNMYRIVTALLTLYVMFFGMKIILSGNVPPRAEIINFVLKMIFVTYFSIGINVSPGTGANGPKFDGMTQWVFPFLLNGINGLASWVMNAAPSELCKFNTSDIEYNPGMAHVSLWDALDCRVSHYLGLDMLSTLLVENMSRNHDFKNFDFFSFSAPPYIYLLIPALISGNMMLVSLALSYPLLVISVAAFMINATVMCMISIVILGILAPLFVPMFLFEYTKGYFESWVKLLISFLLQPMVVATFMIMMFSVYDFGFYGHCKYSKKLISNSIENAIQDGGNSKRDVLIFYVNNNWDDYTEDEKKSCQNSLGYMLNNPIATTYNFAKDSVKEMVTEAPGSGSTENYLAKFQFLSGVILGPGMFFISPKVIFEKIRDILLALITACFTLYLMYNFSSQLAEFAADMTEGVALSNVAINPQLIFKAGMAAIAAAGQAAQGVDKLAAGGGKGDMMNSGGGRPGDKFTSGGGGVGDSVSSGGGEAADLVSGGGGDGGSDLTSSAPARVDSPVSSGFVTRSKIEDIVAPKEEVATIEAPVRKAATERVVHISEPEIVETLPDNIKISREIRTEETVKIEPAPPSEPPQEKNKRLSGLNDELKLEVQSHEKKPGEDGYVAQERKNAEIRDRNQAARDAREALLRSGGGRKSQMKPAEAQRNDGTIENRSKGLDSSKSSEGSGEK